MNAPNLSQKRKQNPAEREEVPIHFDPLVDADGTEIPTMAMLGGRMQPRGLKAILIDCKVGAVVLWHDDWLAYNVAYNVAYNDSGDDMTAQSTFLSGAWSGQDEARRHGGCSHQAACLREA